MIKIYKILRVLEFLWVGAAVLGVPGYGSVIALASLPIPVIARQFMLSWINLRRVRAGEKEYSEFTLSAKRKLFAEIADILADLVAFLCLLTFALQLALLKTGVSVPPMVNLIFLLLPLPLSVRYLMDSLEHLAWRRTLRSLPRLKP